MVPSLSGNPAVPTYQRAGNIIGTVDSARREAFVRQVPPAEEPIESASKKRQCDRSHRSKERDEGATRASAEEGESLEWNNNDSTTQPEEKQLGKKSAVFEGVPHQPPRRRRTRATNIMAMINVYHHYSVGIHILLILCHSH